jgi:Synergist-CTERM protein sorting domain-containing protein
VPAGGVVTIDLSIATPSVDDDTPFGETFAIVAGGQQLGAVDFAVTVSPSGGGISMESDDDVPPDPTADLDGVVDHGGCSAGGGAGWLLVALPALLRRRVRTPSASRVP